MQRHDIPLCQSRNQYEAQTEESLFDEKEYGLHFWNFRFLDFYEVPLQSYSKLKYFVIGLKNDLKAGHFIQVGSLIEP